MTDCYSEHDTGQQGGGGGGAEGVERSGFGLRTSLKINCTELSELIHLNFVCVCVEKWMFKVVFVSSVAFIFLIDSTKTNLEVVAA